MRKNRGKGVYIGITDEQDVVITALQNGLIDGTKYQLNDILEKGLSNLCPQVPEGLIEKVRGLIPSKP